MKQRKKVFMILLIAAGILAADTVWAKWMGNTPILKVRTNYNGGSLSYTDHGLFVDVYQYTDGTREAVWKWEALSREKASPKDSSTC